MDGGTEWNSWGTNATTNGRESIIVQTRKHKKAKTAVVDRTQSPRRHGRTMSREDVSRTMETGNGRNSNGEQRCRARWIDGKCENSIKNKKLLLNLFLVDILCLVSSSGSSGFGSSSLDWSLCFVHTS
jgi:hypothetical protein